MKRSILALAATLLLAVCLQTANAQTTDWGKQSDEYYARAGELYKQQQYREALDLYLKSEQICKEHIYEINREFFVALQTSIGYTYSRLKEYKSANRYLVLACRNGGKTFDLAYLIGNIYYLDEDYENAVEWYEEAIDVSSISDEQKTNGYYMLATARLYWAISMSRATHEYYEQLIESYIDCKVAARGGHPEAKETFENWFKGEYDKSGQLAGKKFSYYTATERAEYVEMVNFESSLFWGHGDYTLSYSEVGSHVEEEEQLTFQSNGHCFLQMIDELEDERADKIYYIYAFDGEMGALYKMSSDIPYASAYDVNYFYVMNGQLYLLKDNYTRSDYIEVDSFRMK